MNKFWESPWVYRIISLFIAIGLFAYINAEKIDNTLHHGGNADRTVLATKKATISVPLELDADTDKYFITGYPEMVKVTVEGNAALVTAVQNTQNFRVTASLRKLTVGTHNVRLTAQGLNNNLTYKINPATIKVKIQNRISKTMAVSVDYNKSAIADGYAAGSPVLSTANVQVTGARSEIERIYEVSASLALARNTKKSVTQTVTLQALDSNGHTLNVVITPQTVRVKLPISMPTKKVPLTFVPSGEQKDGIAYEFKSKTTSVVVTAKKSVLDKLDNLEVPVDVTGITKSTNRGFDLKASDYKVEKIAPKSVMVTITTKATKSVLNDSSTPTASDNSVQTSGSTASSKSASTNSSASSKK